MQFKYIVKAINGRLPHGPTWPVPWPPANLEPMEKSPPAVAPGSSCSPSWHWHRASPVSWLQLGGAPKKEQAGVVAMGEGVEQGGAMG